MRPARLLLGVASGLALLAALAVDLPRAADGRFWSDAATYHAMAGSLAFDHDVAFTARDLARVRASYPGGPQGVFLKRTRGAARRHAPRLREAAALPAGRRAARAAARRRPRPAAAERGRARRGAVDGLRAAARRLERARWRPPARSRVFAAAASCPVYLLWETPELFNLGLVTAGLFAWRRGRPLAAAVLLGAAAYAKPTNAALALPLVLAPLVARRSGARGPRGCARGSSSRCAAAPSSALVFASGFGAQLAGDRRGQLPGRRAQDVLRPLPVRSRA